MAVVPAIKTSHINLAAPSIDLFKETWDFYAAIGFRVSNTVSSHQVWLQLYPPDASNGGMAIKLSLVEPLLNDLSATSGNIKTRQKELDDHLKKHANEMVDTAVISLITDHLQVRFGFPPRRRVLLC